MLSNTAVPKYYGAFREEVIKGNIPVSREISMEMNRIDALIADSNIYYDDMAIEGFVKYCENELTLSDGSDVILLDTFKLWAEQALSWFYFVTMSVYTRNEDGIGGHFVRKKIKKRLINTQYLIVGRGAAKSMYASFIQSYFLNIDKTTTHQIAVAPTMKQAEEVMSPIKTSIARKRGPLFKFLTEGSINNTTGSRALRPKLQSTKRGIENFLTGSLLEVRPMSIDKLQGLRVKCATIDEWLSGDTREDVIGAIEQGASKIDDYFILAISSEGTYRNSVGDTKKMEIMSILKGEYINPHVSIFHYKLDEIEEVRKIVTWVKANPNLGQTVSYETYQREVEKAEKVPSERNDILAKRFGIPMEGYTYYFTYEETIPHKKREFWNMPCALGADLSQGDDFCSFGFLFPLKNEKFGYDSINFITESTYIRLIPSMKKKYDTFIKEGSLIVMNGTILKMNDVYDIVDEYIISKKYDVRALGYDPYNAKIFIERWCAENSEYGVVKVIQGARTESVPLGEIKKIAEERNIIFSQDIVSFTMGNAIILKDTNNNKKLSRKRADQKVDTVAALMDAYIAYKANENLFE